MTAPPAGSATMTSIPPPPPVPGPMGIQGCTMSKKPALKTALDKWAPCVQAGHQAVKRADAAQVVDAVNKLCAVTDSITAWCDQNQLASAASPLAAYKEMILSILRDESKFEWAEQTLCHNNAASAVNRIREALR